MNLATKDNSDLIAVVFGNGPSLGNIDFELFKSYAAFGMNAAYRYWDRIGWYPQYYTCLDLMVGRTHSLEIQRLIEKSNEYGIQYFLLKSALIHSLRIKRNRDRIVNFDILKDTYPALNAPSVTTGSHTAAWAAYLGYKEIFILGVDNNYVEIVDGAKKVKGHMLQMEETPEENPNYFFNDYHRKGDQYYVPNPDRAIHLESWREVAACLKETEIKLINANLLSKVDAVDFCHFADVVAGRQPDIIPRGFVKLTNFLLTHLSSKTSPETKNQKLSLLISGNADRFPLHPFLRAGWQVAWQQPSNDIKKKTIHRYGEDPIQFVENMNELPNNPDYIHFGLAETAKGITSIPVSENYLPAAFTQEISSNTNASIMQAQTAYIRQWKQKGYQLLLLSKIRTTASQTYSSSPEYRLLPYEEQKLQEHEEGWLIGLLASLPMVALMDDIHGLDLNPVQRKLKQGFAFHAICHTEGVSLEENKVVFNGRKKDDFFSHTFHGRVHPGELIEMEVTFDVPSPVKLTLMLCRDGSTPFEQVKRTLIYQTGLHTTKLSIRFASPHHGVRLQLSTTGQPATLNDVTTRLQIPRNNRPVDAEGGGSEAVPVLLISDEQLLEQKRKSNYRIPLKTRIKRKIKLLIYSSATYLFPIGSPRRAALKKSLTKLSNRFGIIQ